MKFAGEVEINEADQVVNHSIFRFRANFGLIKLDEVRLFLIS